MTVLVEVVVDRGVGGSELLQRLEPIYLLKTIDQLHRCRSILDATLLGRARLRPQLCTLVPDDGTIAPKSGSESDNVGRSTKLTTDSSPKYPRDQNYRFLIVSESYQCVGQHNGYRE